MRNRLRDGIRCDLCNEPHAAFDATAQAFLCRDSKACTERFEADCQAWTLADEAENAGRELPDDPPLPF